LLIYLDASVVLSELFSEEVRPPPALWKTDLIASRLLAYEVWNRIHAREISATHGGPAAELLGRVHLIDMHRAALERAMEEFPIAVRTMDGLHLATIDFLLRRRAPIALASYDKRLLRAAEANGVPIHPMNN
jgi:hypothetical protein